MNDVRQKFFLAKALEMGEKWKEESAPICSNCGEKTQYSEAVADLEHNGFLVHWSCPCGNVETDQRVRGLPTTTKTEES